MRNKANFQKVKLNVNNVLTRDYDQMDTWSIGKSKPNSNPIQSQNKPNTKPIQTQFKPKQTQFYTNPAAKKFHLMLVFGCRIVFNSRFNVKKEQVNQHNLNNAGDLRFPPMGPRVSKIAEVNRDGRFESIS
jgi:hypothetical protein